MTVASATAPDLRRWRIALGAVLALSAGLNAWGLSRLGYGNAYYAAAVRSMLTSWHNLWYASFDAGGFVSIDKPPLGFWLQAASARILGFDGVALMIPGVVAGVASVALVHHLVRRAWGRPAALLAALLLALSPISVVTARSNLVDGVLVAILLLAALAVTRAAESGRLRWLLLCAVLVGLGFNVKMLEAYLVVPAYGLLYLATAPASWRRRIAHLGLAAAVMVALSLSWVTAVDHVPATQRPYVGSSTGDSEVNLALGYNGWGRVTGGLLGRGAARPAAPNPPTGSARPALAAFTARESGAPGPLRLLAQPLASQTGWLLPLALIGLVAAAARQRWRGPADGRRRSLLLWGAWLLTVGVFFSVAGFIHAYYLAMLGPAIAALAAVGLTVMWEEARRAPRRRWMLMAAVAVTVAEAVVTLADFPEWSRWLTPLVAVSAAVAVAALAMRRWTVVAAIAGAVALVAAPAAWTLDTVATASSAALPSAGPTSATLPAFLRRPVRDPGGATFTLVDPALLGYLEAHRGDDRYLMATLAAMRAAPYMLASGRPAMALGGFLGADRIVDPGQLAGVVSRGVVRFLLVPAPATGSRQGFAALFAGLGGGVNADLVGWVRTHCAVVPPGRWSSSRGPGLGEQLFDCAPAMGRS
jgi:4-amino-4-deoxy-L-arabinose transferase-like glycosyltransferase